MAQFYFRTKQEWIDDGLLCADGCNHLDCINLRTELTYPCPYCKKSCEGTACFIEDSRLCHAACVIAAVEG